MITHENFKEITRKEFKECFDRVCGQKRRKMMPDVSGLERMALAAPPPLSTDASFASTG